MGFIHIHSYTCRSTWTSASCTTRTLDNVGEDARRDSKFARISCTRVVRPEHGRPVTTKSAISPRESHTRPRQGTEDASVVRSFVPLPERRMDLRQRTSTIKAHPNCDAFLSMDLLIEPERLCSHIVLCLASAWNIARDDPSSI